MEISKKKKKRVDGFSYVKDLSYCDIDPLVMADSVDGDY